MTREAFKALLRHPQTTILLNRWAQEEMEAQRIREQRDAIYKAWMLAFFKRTDPVTK